MTPIAEYLHDSKINVPTFTRVLVDYLLISQAEIDEIDLMGEPVEYIDAKDEWNKVLDFGKLLIDEEILRKNHWL